MPRENVEIVRRSVAAFNRGDLDGALEEWAPDAIWDWTNSRGFDAGVFRGHDEIRAFWGRFLDSFDAVRLEVVAEHPTVQRQPVGDALADRPGRRRTGVLIPLRRVRPGGGGGLPGRDGPRGLSTTGSTVVLRGRNGIETQARSAWLITIRDGKQTSLTLYQTKQEALEAAGLSE